MKKLIKKNDVYFIQVLAEKIVINNNYEGVIVFNSEMTKAQEIPLFNEICIYSSFVTDESELILFCPENEKIVYINFEKNEVHIIVIPPNLSSEILDKIVWNGERKCIFVTTKNKYISLDKKTDKIENDILLEKELVVNREVKEDEILNNIRQMYGEYNNIDIRDGIVAITYERKILLYEKAKVKEYVPPKGYIFNNAKLLKKHFEMLLVILCNNKSDNESSIIFTIQI